MRRTSRLKSWSSSSITDETDRHVYVWAAAAVAAAILTVSFWLYAQTSAQNGYSVLTPDGGRPTGAALFTHVNSTGVVVSEAAVGVQEPVRSARIFVDEAGKRTAIAVVNTSQQPASATLILRDTSGSPISSIPLSLSAGQHLSRFTSELFSNLPSNFTGSLTVQSDRDLAAITLRETLNARGETLYTTLPVVPLTSAPSGPIVFPHLAVGGGYTSQLILINPGSKAIHGTVHLYTSDGQPLPTRLGGNTLSDFDYDIAPDGVYSADLDGVSELSAGYAVAIPEIGSGAPAGSVIFQLKSGGRLITEAGVGATAATTAARMFVDYLGTRTGVAIANPSDASADVTLTLMDRAGVEVAVIRQMLPPRHHMARFVNEWFPSASEGYSGLLEIRSSIPVVPITLKLTTNTREESVLTTLPVADLSAPTASQPQPLVFPHVVLGGGFTTRLILLNASTASAASGRIAFFLSDGTPMVLPMGGVTATEFAYQLTAGAGRRLFPGNSDGVASVMLLDPLSNAITNEIVINEGNTVPLRLQIRDVTTAQRDDFDAGVAILDSEVAGVDAHGGIVGKKAGFSTVTISAGGYVTTATATVVKVDSGAGGFETTGIAQDSSRRLYLASTPEHSILLAQDLKQAPALYAGIPRTFGLRNDTRLQSLFKNPAFLALNQADGSLFVSDGGNHVIRRIRAGLNGRVETAAGTGTAGSVDSSMAESSFNNPQGIALDSRGNLWVADSGNHTIRRINLVTGRVETIAGKAGAAGLTDARGDQARFRSPSGIAVENETTFQQLERLRTAGPPPLVRVIVADTGNGLIRRVFETGDVETIRSVQVVQPAKALAKPAEAGQLAQQATASNFSSPTGVALDSAGNIYVAEQESSQVRVILRSGDIVAAAQPGTFDTPRGIAIAENGKVVVAGRGRAASELAYGEPRIASVTPDQFSVAGGENVTVKGSNFAPDSLLVMGGVLVANRTITDSQTIRFKAPPLLSGRSTLTIQNRGGLAQRPVQVNPPSLDALPISYITTVAGGSTYAGEGAAAVTAPIVPWTTAVDLSGNIFVADIDNNRVRRIEARTATIITVAGTGTGGFGGDNGPAIAARLSSPTGVAFDPGGNLLIAANNRIRKVNSATGIITTVAGGGEYGFCGDNFSALRACFAYITSFTADAQGNLFIMDYYNHRVSRVDAVTNIITTVAGNGEDAVTGDGGPATAAAIGQGYGVAVDDSRQILYVAAGGHIRRVDLRTKIISTAVKDTRAIGLATDVAGNLFFASGDIIQKLDAATGAVTTVADGLARAWSVTVDGAGNLIVGELDGHRVRRINAGTGVITTVAGNGSGTPLGDGGPAFLATVRDPSGITIDSNGNLFITDTGNDRIRRVDASTRVITTIAGGGNPAIHTEGILATDSHFHGPAGRVPIDDAGNFYVADILRISRIDGRTNRMTRFAGNGGDVSVDGFPARDTGVDPQDLALDRRGNLYVAEHYRVRRIDIATGTIATVNKIPLGYEVRIAVDSADNLFITDWDNARIWRVDAQTQTLTTEAGGGNAKCALNQLATSVGLLPIAMDVDRSGNMFIVDWCYAYGIRKIASATRIITSVAGYDGPLGDNGPANAAFLNYPYGVAVDKAGNVFIADTSNQRIRAIRGPLP